MDAGKMVEDFDKFPSGMKALGDWITQHDTYAPFTVPPLFGQWGKIDFVFLAATMPGWHGGD